MKNTQPLQLNCRQNSQDLIADIRGLVLLHQELGIDGYPATAGLLRFLKPSRAAISHDITNTLADVEDQIKDCRRCSRHLDRQRIIFGQGNPHPHLLLIGQAPGPEEERRGLPYQGEAGVLLDRMLTAIKLSREQIYLTTLVKCARPSQPVVDGPEGSMAPTTDEVRECLPFLHQQITTLKPALICTMGPLPAQTLLRRRQSLIRLRGKFHDFQGVPLMPTFSPDYLLVNQEMKNAAWQDLQMIQKKLQILLKDK
ncbi:MAG: uracil-DNA glycosylase [Desulfobulbaceae bacterium]|nr:MAG: uracil-DNA glycosylase [Desulfobulbaceae bacterium]